MSAIQDVKLLKVKTVCAIKSDPGFPRFNLIQGNVISNNIILERKTKKMSLKIILIKILN